MPLSKLSKPLSRELHGLRIEVGADESPSQPQRGNADAAGSHERIGDDVAWLRALADEDLRDRDRLFGRIPAMDARLGDDVGHAEIVQPALALLEEQDELVARPVVIAHADRALVPHQRLPELEAGPLGLRLGDEHRLGVAEQIEVRVGLEHAKHFGEQLAETLVRENAKPVVARGLAVLQARRRSDGAMLLERFVRRVGDHQIHGLGWQLAQPVHGIERSELEERLHGRHYKSRDSGFGIRDSGFGTRDPGSGSWFIVLS